MLDIEIPEHAIIKVCETPGMPEGMEMVYQVKVIDLDDADTENTGLGDYNMAEESYVYFTTDHGLFGAYTHREIIIRHSKDIALKF